MKNLFVCIPFFLLIISSFSNLLKADTLLRTHPNGGIYGGGSGYTDSYGNTYNDAPHAGGGIYGGGVIYDENMNAYDCNSIGECIKR